MENLKTTFKYVLIIAVIMVSEAVRRFYGIPVTILDILLFPVFLLFIVRGVKSLAFHRKSRAYDQTKESSTKLLVFSLIVGLFIMIPLGVFSLWHGIKDPLRFFSGVKGSVHGYTLVELGVFITGAGGYIILKTTKELYQRLLKHC